MLCPCIHARIYLRKSTIYIWYTRLLFYIDVINTQEHVHRLTREIITENDLLFVDMQAHAHETRHFGSFPSFCIFSIFSHTIPFLWLSPMHLRTITIFVWQKKKTWFHVKRPNIQISAQGTNTFMFTNIHIGYYRPLKPILDVASERNFKFTGSWL